MATLVNEYVIKVDSEDGTVTVNAGFSVTAGNCLVLIAGAIKSDTSDTALATGVTGGGTWSTPVNVLTGTEYQPNAFAAVCPNASSGTLSFDIALDTSSSNQVTGIVQEWTDVPTSSVEIVAAQVGSATSGTSTSTSNSGALSTTNGVAIVGGFGWGGLFYNTSGWTPPDSGLPHQNGVDGKLGGHVMYRLLEAADASGIIGTMTHDASAGTAAIMVLLKDDAPALTIRCTLDSSKFTSADTGITAFVWVNAWPDTAVAKRITGLAGDATAGRLDIPNTATNFPASLQAGDSVRVILSNGTDTSGLFTATIV